MNSTVIAKRTAAGVQPRRYAQLPRYFRWFSDHCVLRQLDESDIARIWKAVLHPGFARCFTGPIPRSIDDVSDFVRSSQADWQRGVRYTMAVMRKQTQEFVGCVELQAGSDKAVWTIDWFIHPDFVGVTMAGEALVAAADLMFSALDAQKLYATCAPGHAYFERLLNDAGFIELVPAGSLDHATGLPRRDSLYEFGRRDWQAMRIERGVNADESSFVSRVTTGLRMELALV